MKILPIKYFLIVLLSTIFGWPLPSNAKSPFEGMKIESIKIQNNDIFDLSDDNENGSFYKAANYFHIRTKKIVIQNQLLFSIGDTYKQALIDESERILRQNKYITDAKIRAEMIDESVAITIITDDSWSTKPTISFGHTGGKSNTSFGLKEDNFLGTGVQLGISFKKGVDRDSTILHVFDRQIGSSWYQFDAQHQINSDGHLNSIGISQPFYSYSTNNSFGVSFWDETKTDAFYSKGIPIYRYQSDLKFYEIFKGTTSDAFGGRLRHTLGYHWENHSFSALDLESDGLSVNTVNFERLINSLPKNRTESYAYYKLEYLKNNYLTLTNIDKIARVEDIYRGFSAYVSMGIGETTNNLDGHVESLMKIDSALQYTNCLNKNMLFRSNLFFRQDHIDHSGITNIISGFDISLLIPQNNQFKIFTNLSMTNSKNSHLDQQNFLGGELGFRGYPLRYASGSKVSQFTIEQRYYSPFNPLNLLNFGAAIFLDKGRVSGTNTLESLEQKSYTSVGVGLRLTSNKSSKGDIIHFDISRPLDSEYDERKWQFSLVAKSTF